MDTGKANCSTAENNHMQIDVDNFIEPAVRNENNNVTSKAEPQHIDFGTGLLSKNSISSVINQTDDIGTDRKIENLNGFSPFI